MKADELVHRPTVEHGTVSSWRGPSHTRGGGGGGDGGDDGGRLCRSRRLDLSMNRTDSSWKAVRENDGFGTDVQRGVLTLTRVKSSNPLALRSCRGGQEWRRR